MSDSAVAKIAELIKGVHSAMVTTIDGEGHLVSRPMAVQELEFDGDLWFFTDATSPKVGQLHADPRVNVSFASGSTWVSVTGTAIVVDDRAKAKDLWNAGVEAWYPDGPLTPELRLLKVHAVAAEYWDTPGGRIATILSFAKAKVTGTRYDGGENKTVSL